MTTRIIIATHGDVDKKEKIYVGKTDLSLVEENKSKNLGLLLKEVELYPDMVFATPSQRTVETANLAVAAMGLYLPVHEETSFPEIDLGADEGCPENEVRLRLGTIAAKAEGHVIADLSIEELLVKGDVVLDLWHSKGAVPNTWKIDEDKTIKSWDNFAKKVMSECEDMNVLIVTDEATAHFSPYLTGNFVDFSKENKLSLETGNFAIFEKAPKGDYWICRAWDENPEVVLKEIYEEDEGCCGGSCGCGGHHHEEHECACGHSHSEEHECCGGHHHGEGHECCGGGCGCGHKH
ncbi:MAG: histidine phosphatase family protein [Alphaproteobacteria bacterium]